jgi:hypothetical protein
MHDVYDRSSKWLSQPRQLALFRAQLANPDSC